LFQGAARLASSVLVRCPGDPLLAVEALLHGADGVVVPATARPCRDWKTLLGGHGLTVRQ